MIDPRFVWLGVALALIGSLYYVRAILSKGVRPNLVTWTLWAAMAVIGFAAQIDGGVGLSAMLTLSGGFGPIAVVVTSLFVGRGVRWKISGLDRICGLLSIGALLLWVAFDDPVLAIIMILLADIAAAIPTVIKAWCAPQSERAGYYVLVALNGTITVFTLDTWTFAHWAFPLYLTSFGAVLALIIYFRGRHLRIHDTARQPAGPRLAHEPRRSTR